MSDFVDSFKLFLLERLSNPLINSFALSWCIVNYQFFMILISGDDVVVKFIMIEDYFAQTSWVFGWSKFWGYGITLPICTMITYVYALPFVSWRLLRIHYDMTRKLKDEINTSLGKTLLTNQQAGEANKLIRDRESQIEKLTRAC